ncbi:MAG: CDF family Co(II)/Ni(II) efflux transporter DmeF [Xanthomonadales bacterium]|nr:CDF family Co(II)/Ni(II) efflux transporter DmeF [Xanthomonadales bacterium]
MNRHESSPWQHDHIFGQDQVRAGEKRTLIVVMITAVMMVVEIAAGLIYGSMALLADGLHMASHATALGVAFFAYVLSRRWSANRSFTFGAGKINSLAGFASAVMLMGFVLIMAVESTGRLIKPLAIAFDQALIVAVVGLFVNGICAWILIGTPHEHGHSQNQGDDHEHHHDQNLRAAYLHVLADALTSVLAIVALLAGKYLGANWLDPAMGLVGAILVARWSYELIKDTSGVLLDRQADSAQTTQLRKAIEQDSNDQVANLHIWSIGHGIYAAEITVVSNNPQRPEQYKALILAKLGVAHVTVEVHRRPGH